MLSQTHDASLQAHLNTNGISESMAHVGLRVQTARATPRAADTPTAESHSGKSPGPQPPPDLKKIYVNPEVRRCACKSSGRPCMWAENLEWTVPCACHEPCISAMQQVYEMIMRTVDELDSLQSTVERPTGCAHMGEAPMLASVAAPAAPHLSSTSSTNHSHVFTCLRIPGAGQRPSGPTSGASLQTSTGWSEASPASPRQALPHLWTALQWSVGLLVWCTTGVRQALKCRMMCHSWSYPPHPPAERSWPAAQTGCRCCGRPSRPNPW